MDTILRLGCGLAHEDIFYSSGHDTGVPSGTDLNAHVRAKVGDAGLVVAILTPRFQERPFCMAELGAAWSRADSLFPLSTAQMARSDLDGVLAGMTVRRLDDPTALDELHDRVCDELGRRTRATTWGGYKAQWLGEFDVLHRALLATPATRVISAAACSRLPGHMEVFWTDGSGAVYYRWWLRHRGWSVVLSWDDPPATFVAAVSRETDDELLFGVYERGRVWMRTWERNDDGWDVAGEPEWIPGEVSGPLTSMSHESGALELTAWTPSGEPCHTWREHDEWAPWTTNWWPQP